MMLMKEVKKQAGVGIIELMVSIAIGLFILAGVLQLYLTSTQNVSSFEGSSRIQENARYAFARFEKDIGQAGNMGCFSSTFMGLEFDNRFKNNVGGGAGVYAFNKFVGGANNVGPGINGASSTDQLIVRFASTGRRYPVLEHTSPNITLPAGVVDSIDVGQTLVISDCSMTTVFVASDVDTGNNTVEHAQGSANPNGDPYNIDGELIKPEYLGANSSDDIIEGVTPAYVYISESGGTGVAAYEIGNSAAGTCDANNPQFCALKRNGLEIVEGVEDLQIEYGWMNGNNLVFQSANLLTANPDNWQLVDRVRVEMTFNSINTATTNEGVGLLSRTYSQVFVIRNQLPASI